MITMTTNIAEVHSTRLWSEHVAPCALAPKQRRSVPMLGGLDFYNNTGVSEVECLG